MESTLEVGSSVIYVNTHGARRNALVTKVWNSTGNLPGCNVVFVVDSEDKTDGYGRQIERATSVVHKSVMPAPGNFWAWPSEIE